MGCIHAAVPPGSTPAGRQIQCGPLAMHYHFPHGCMDRSTAPRFQALPTPPQASAVLEPVHEPRANVSELRHPLLFTPGTALPGSLGGHATEISSGSPLLLLHGRSNARLSSLRPAPVPVALPWFFRRRPLRLPTPPGQARVANHKRANFKVISGMQSRAPRQASLRLQSKMISRSSCPSIRQAHRQVRLGPQVCIKLQF